jgi:hypothetical protein
MLAPASIAGVDLPSAPAAQTPVTPYTSSFTAATLGSASIRAAESSAPKQGISRTASVRTGAQRPRQMLGGSGSGGSGPGGGPGFGGRGSGVGIGGPGGTGVGGVGGRCSKARAITFPATAGGR